MRKLGTRTRSNLELEVLYVIFIVNRISLQTLIIVKKITINENRNVMSFFVFVRFYCSWELINYYLMQCNYVSNSR
jgi:hypothetical protein